MKQAGKLSEEIATQQRKINTEQIKAVNAYADALNNVMKTGFMDVLSGKSNISSLGSTLMSGLASGYQTAVASGLTNLFGATGLSSIFGQSMTGLTGVAGSLATSMSTAFDKGGQVAYNWIYSGFQDAVAGTYNASAAAGGGSNKSSSNLLGSSWSGGLSGILGNTSNMTGAGGGGLLGSLFGAIGGLFGGQSSGGSGGGFLNSIMGAFGNSGGTGGNLPQSILMGLSSYASNQQAGKGGFISSVSAGLTGAGQFMGGALGGILSLGGMILSLFGGSKKSTAIQEQTQTTQVASKIDVTNKTLNLINRNLVALNQAMTTYILPSSAYFSTATSLSDEFSLAARRGL